MKDKEQITIEYITKLQKRLAYIEKRNKTLKKCNDNLIETNRDLNAQLRAEKRFRDIIVQILFEETHEGYYALELLMKWIQQVAFENEKLKNEIDSLKFDKTIKNAREIGIDSCRYEFKDSKTDQVSKVVAWFHSLS